MAEALWDGVAQAYARSFEGGVTWRAQAPAVRERIGEVYGELVEPLLVSGRLEFPVECVFVEAVVADR